VARVVAASTHPPAGRDEDPSEHLDGGGLASSIRSDIADCLPGHDRTRDPVNGVHDSGLPAHPSDLPPHRKGAAQIL
jgi:hypothetical protein